MNNFKNKSVFVASYTFFKNEIRTNTSGPIVPLIEYCKKNFNLFILLEQPLPGSQFDYGLLSVWHKNNKKEFKINAPFFAKNIHKLNSNKTFISLKIRDIYFLLYSYFILKNNFKLNKINFCISLECLNTSFLILFKKIFKIEKIIYYIFDWSPNRYSYLLNKIYLFLDKFSTYNSDFTWNITYTIAKYKITHFNFKKNLISKQLYVPYSPYPIKKFKNPSQNKIVYAGGLIEENGAHLLVPILKRLKKLNKNIKLLIIGDGELRDKILNDIRINKLSNNIIFYGYISDQKKIMSIQSECALGLAPYPKNNRTRKKFGDVIKIRMYFASGIPTISSDVPPVFKEIIKEKLGIVIKKNIIEEFSLNIHKLLKNKKELNDLKKNVIKKSIDTSWSQTFTKALNNEKSIRI